MPRSPAHSHAHLTILTKQMLQLMQILMTFTYKFAVELLNVDNKAAKRRLYDVLCALEGIGLLSKNNKRYTCRTQWYQLPRFKDDSLKRYIGIIYRHVRINPGVFHLRDLAEIFNITPHRMYDIFCILKVIGTVTKMKGECYDTAALPQSELEPYWKLALDNIWGDSPEVQVVQSESPEVVWIDNNELTSDSHIIIQSDSPEFQFVYIDDLILESYIIQNNSGFQSVWILAESNGTLSDSHKSEVQCMDTKDLTAESNSTPSDSQKRSTVYGRPRLFSSSTELCFHSAEFSRVL